MIRPCRAFRETSATRSPRSSVSGQLANKSVPRSGGGRRLGEAFPNLRRVECPAVDRGQGEVPVEEVPRRATLAHGAQAQGVRPRQQRADEVPRADFAAVHVDALFQPSHVAAR